MAKTQRAMSIVREEQNSAYIKPMINNSLTMKLTAMETIEPITENQKKFWEAYDRGDYFMGLLGSAGTGKTYIALYKALQEVLSKDNAFKKIIIVRSNVSSREMGHLPGTAEEKMEVYEMPYMQICSSLFNRKDAWQRLKEQDKVEFLSGSYLRGVTFEYSIVIVEEVANFTLNEISTAIGRLGNYSKLILIGDVLQNDLLHSKRNEVSGLKEFKKIAASMPEYTEINFTTDDICRYNLCKSWIIAYENYLSKNNLY